MTPVNAEPRARCHDGLDKEHGHDEQHPHPGQKAQLETRLLLQQQELERELALQLGGDADRIRHAREQLLQDLDGEAAHGADRDVDLARSDATLQALREIGAALRRLARPDYGFCADCGQAIPFDRLRLHPQAGCCTGCQAERERQHGRAASTGRRTTL